MLPFSCIPRRGPLHTSLRFARHISQSPSRALIMAPEESNPASSNTKRKATRSISPPAIKRKAQSSISKSAVNNFFKPTSQKPKERTSWSERAAHNDTPATLLVGRYEPEDADEANQKRTKIAAFDFDSTLITTASGKKFGDDPNDWKWWDPTVPTKLQHMYAENYRIIILSNQAGLTLHRDPKAKGPKNLGRVENFKQKCNAVLAQLDIPISVYAATGHDIYRKPRIGMWKELCKDYDIKEAEIDRENSLFVGDAGGRTAQLKQNSNSFKAVAAKDFSCSDRNFAHNLEVAYKTPEEFFLGKEPREFLRDFDVAQHPYADDDDGIIFEKKNDKDVVLFCGPPGAGKSTFFWRHLKPLGYERVNQDTLKSRAKCFKAAADHLGEGKSVAIDNTNPDASGRAEWIEFTKKHKIPIRCVWFKTPLELCQHNDIVRALNKPIMNPEAREALPKLAFNGFASRFKEPNKTKEGFQDVLEVEFKFRGTREEYAIWGRYWT